MSKYKILAINPGSTSTKIAVFENNKALLVKTLKHSSEELKPFRIMVDQYEFRKQIILDELKNSDFDITTLDAIVGRGGLLKPILSGVYEVNEQMKKDLKVGVQGQHASNLGGLIADEIAKMTPNAKAYIADPVVVDELSDEARVTGHPLLKRVSIFHALNQKAIARTHARAIGRPYEELNFVIAHLGGGISIGAHYKGRVFDVNNALDGAGPMSPERSGSLPAGQLAELCFSGKYTLEEVQKMINGKGGLIAHLGTNQAYEVEKMAEEGNVKAKLIQDAMCYQIGKWIGSMATVLKGEVHGILLTGGMANSKYLCEYVREMVSYIAPVFIYPGEDEMGALATNGLMVLQGDVVPKVYE
ncbi:MAG: butyrate kinase [Prevotellaceae bacterium]|jgi:butyrate kinase|nr:butyrate kinase [Prevotellaceae bacterium]